MPSLRSAGVMVLATSLIAGASSVASANTSEKCRVTNPNRNTPPPENPSPGHHGNGALWTALWPEGRVVFSGQASPRIASGVSGILPDGSLMMKWPWWRGVRGKLSIEGRRLDAPAPPLRAAIADGYGDKGFQATALIFPTEGCWEVSGKVGEATLTFVTLVVKVGERK